MRILIYEVISHHSLFIAHCESPTKTKFLSENISQRRKIIPFITPALPYLKFVYFIK